MGGIRNPARRRTLAKPQHRKRDRRSGRRRVDRDAEPEPSGRGRLHRPDERRWARCSRVADRLDRSVRKARSARIWSAGAVEVRTAPSPWARSKCMIKAERNWRFMLEGQPSDASLLVFEV